VEPFEKMKRMEELGRRAKGEKKKGEILFQQAFQINETHAGENILESEVRAFLEQKWLLYQGFPFSQLVFMQIRQVKLQCTHAIIFATVHCYLLLPFAVYQTELEYEMGFILLGRNKCVVLGKH
jgi:hypothetical protein